MISVIRTEQLTKFYGKRRGLDGLNLEVHAGEVFGFLGPNGAGKTTTIRLLLDLLRPTSGHVEVLGTDPRQGGVELRRRVGYLPGDFVVDGRQTVAEFLNFAANLRGGVDRSRMHALAADLELDMRARIRGLSKGNRQKVGLVQAFMHQPELLILDEPTSGLDPLVQQIFLQWVRGARSEGQTVFMSSHVLSEVQQVADRAGIVRDGKLVVMEEVETLRARAMPVVEVAFDGPVPADAFRHIPGVQNLELEGHLLRCQVTTPMDHFIKAIAGYTVVSMRSTEPNLEELFFNYYRHEEPIDVA
jgi:ABC-2 type transport system ATP-binding protein